jgi:hypothetical protein
MLNGGISCGINVSILDNICHLNLILMLLESFTVYDLLQKMGQKSQNEQCLGALLVYIV